VWHHRVGGSIGADTCERITTVDVSIPEVFGAVTMRVALTAVDRAGAQHTSVFTDTSAIDVGL
jgi:hypothetical protein